MISNSEQTLLREAYQSVHNGILSIENFLPKVENDDMNYDLNRQLQDYREFADLCKDELHKKGEVLEEVFADSQQGDQLSNISFNDKSHVGGESSDQYIAREVVAQIQQRVDAVRQFTDNSSSEAVSKSIAMKLIEEEENHMEWLKSYVE